MGPGGSREAPWRPSGGPLRGPGRLAGGPRKDRSKLRGEEEDKSEERRAKSPFWAFRPDEMLISRQERCVSKPLRGPREAPREAPGGIREAAGKQRQRSKEASIRKRREERRAKGEDATLCVSCRRGAYFQRRTVSVQAPGEPREAPREASGGPREAPGNPRKERNRRRAEEEETSEERIF